MPAPAKKINLLPPSEFEASFWGKFLKWAVSAGRYIIIMTELIVIIAFLSRFKLDSDISNLNSQITGKKNILEAQYPAEMEFRKAQSRINAVRQMEEDNLGAPEIMDQIAAIRPDEVKFSNWIISTSQISIQGTTVSELILGRMLEQISRDTRWRGVELTQVSADKTKGITFSLTITR